MYTSFNALSSHRPPALLGEPLAWRQHQAADVDEHVAQLPGWHLRYDQLGAGRFGVQFLDLRLPGLQLFRETTTHAVRQQGGLGQGSLGLAFMRRGQGEGALNGQPFAAQAVLACLNQDLDLRTPAQCDLTGLVLAAELVPPALAKRQAPAVRALAQDGAASRRLRTLVVDSLALARRATRQRESADAAPWQRAWPAGTPWRAVAMSATGLAQWRDDLLDACQAVMDEGADLGDLQRARHRSELVQRACARMLAQLEAGESVSQTTLCRELGVSQRKLSYCFQTVLGLPPLVWLRVARLNAVRRSLRQGGAGSIYDVATQHGFWHFGHFSVAYRAQFGERPSDTLRHATGLPGRA